MKGRPKTTTRWELWYVYGAWRLFVLPHTGEGEWVRSYNTWAQAASANMGAPWYVRDYAERGCVGAGLRARKVNRKHPDKPGPYKKGFERSYRADSKRRPG